MKIPMFSRFRKSGRRRWLIFFLMFFGFVFLLVFLYGRFLLERETYADHAPSERPVKVMEPAADSGFVYAQVLGRVMGKQTVDVRAAVPGWVKSASSGRGREIKKDGIILELYDFRTETRLDEARYGLERARMNLAEARRVYRRNAALLEKGIVSADETEASRNLSEAEASGVLALEASYRRAKWHRDSLKVRSPIDGSVVEIVPDIGQEVRAGDIVARVVNLSGRKVIASVDISVAGAVGRGDGIEVFLERDGERQSAMGEVEGVSPGSDDLSGTYDIEISISDPSVKWWPGEIVSVRIPVRRLDDVVRVPRTAVLSADGETFVMVEKEGKALRVPVKVVWADDRSGYASSGALPAGARIITEGNFGLRPGEPVKIID